MSLKGHQIPGGSIDEINASQIQFQARFATEPHYPSRPWCDWGSVVSSSQHSYELADVESLLVSCATATSPTCRLQANDESIGLRNVASIHANAAQFFQEFDHWGDWILGHLAVELCEIQGKHGLV